MHRMPLSRWISLAAAGLLGLAVGESLTATPVLAEVFRSFAMSLNRALAEITGDREPQARDLVANGQRIEFSPYQSRRPVLELADEWTTLLRERARPAKPIAGDGYDEGLAAAADVITTPRISRVGTDFAVIVSFFEGDGEAALAYQRAAVKGTNAGHAAGSTMPAVVVLIRRSPGADTTDVLMSRIDDVSKMLASFSEPQDGSKLPPAFRPPAGSTILADVGDFGRGHNSRTIITSAAISRTAWADRRQALLQAEGFSIDRADRSGETALAMHGRRGPVEADVVYTAGDKPGEVVEVIEIRQALAEGDPR